MEKITYVEIDLNRCSNRYGVSPCAASIPATGDIKCFNCFSTCQDKDNYSKEIVTSRHSSVSSKPPINIDAIPDMSSYSIRPAQVDLGESIGTRASVSMVFKDARFPDTGPEGDYYLSDRNYDPYTQGSYWGKFRARYPFIQGSDVRLIRGDTNQSLNQMETRHFIVDTVAGPDSSGRFTLTCKDALKLADGKKAQAPIMSNGEILTSITSTQTSLTLTPVGVGDAEYPSSGFVNLGGDEICSFTRVADSMAIVRAQFNTDAKEHDDGSRVQLCLQYSSQLVTDVINDLLVNYSSIPQNYIPLSDWNSEDNAYIKRTYTALIAEPESVTDLVNELLQQTASSIWWDDVSRLIQFRVLKSVDTNAALYNDNLILADTFSAKDQNGKRVSQVWTYFGQINPLEDLTKNSNYSRTQINVNPESETNFEGRPSIKRLYSRWITATSRNAAERLNELILSRYSTPPRIISFALQRDVNLTQPSIGGGYNVSNRNLQDETGANAIMPIQVIQMKSTDVNFSVIGEEVLYLDTVAPEDPAFKYVDFETSGESNINLFDSAIASNNTAPEAGDTWTFNVKAGVTIGSNSTSSVSIQTGSWPSGIDLILINNGQIIGKGGAAGGGGTAILPSVTNGGNGGNGGDAISCSYDLTIENNNIIGCGGGGGGGGGAINDNTIVKPLATIGGGGGGGGNGTATGGAGGVTSPSSGDFFVGLTGNNGNSSTYTVAGLGGAAVSLDAGGGGTTIGGAGGAGGQYADGANGTIGVKSSSSQGAIISSAGIGGLAGSAINKNGNTVTITNNGNIFGAINA